MSAYRFPPLATLDRMDPDRQFSKAREELNEAENAYQYESLDRVVEELFDTIHAIEGIIRILITDEECVEEIRAQVIAKNARRGYYKVVD